jgi:hypothetical protein
MHCFVLQVSTTDPGKKGREENALSVILQDKKRMLSSVRNSRSVAPSLFIYSAFVEYFNTE